MGAISGSQFIKRIDHMQTEIWLDGQRIQQPISQHPAFKGIMKTKASLYDLQLVNLESMTFTSPKTKERVGLSYLQPKTVDDLRRRRNMMEQWARTTYGLVGRSPDYLNSVIMSFASSAYHFIGKENCFPAHIQALYERARDQDLSFTHSFVNPQVNRSQSYFEMSAEPISAKIIGTSDEGLIVKGAKLLATQGGLTDEVLIFSAPRFLGDPDEAFAFSIPSDTKGLRFICRESFVGGESSFNYPLSSRFEEPDSIVVFDHVIIPWDCVFFYRNVEVAADFFSVSSFHPFAIHQVLTRQIVKTEFILSVAQKVVQTINIGEYLHVQEKLSEIILGLETLKALLIRAEQEAALDSWGYMRPSLQPLQAASALSSKIFPRFSEIIQLIGASGMIALPTEKDFHCAIEPDLEKYLQGASDTAENRVKIFRVAWDLTMSSFGTRQTQYERYFFGDPVRLASQLYQTYPKTTGLHMLDTLLDSY
ncbi:4-hydroxyphenylacetate 3-monooxygenase, oxygenase component [Sporosarcina sp. PTS2304]|uniref:4-hydroxyphenylacetate 3-monooxygenase, oxygenase component n=1 Tax=Sporosarcina sp. PTS2304 TaxID=2283194 RepID=UPI000E0D0C6F|nr:4-hydroxyphenylacetate 3-monooxygenase, oxygenase component [Sporosarcina sp. PTS2304]AXI00376.1 4-hydroxyphenylacetate 3-monooxygenase, oxygenase component [Sporosarcina sp. PTS2304]